MKERKPKAVQQTLTGMLPRSMPSDAVKNKMLWNETPLFKATVKTPEQDEFANFLRRKGRDVYDENGIIIEHADGSPVKNFTAIIDYDIDHDEADYTTEEETDD